MYILPVGVIFWNAIVPFRWVTWADVSQCALQSALPALCPGSSTHIPPGHAHSCIDYKVPFIFLISYLFIWLHRVLVAARRIFDLRCRIWGLFPRPGIKPSPPALEVQSLGPWTTGEVPSRPHLNATFPTHPPPAPAALLLPDALDPRCSAPDITAPPWPLP